MTANEIEQRMIAYLLGELPEAENVRIEEEYLAGDDAIAPLLAIETELYDAYARDTLPLERRRLFEQRFLTTPEQRQRLEFSRALLNVPRPKAALQRAYWWSGSVALIAVAAALVLAVILWPRPTTPQPPQSVQQAPAERQLVVVSFSLGPGIGRDGGDEPTLDLSGNPDMVRIAATLEKVAHSPLDAVLRTPEGVVIWKSDRTQPPTLDAGSVTVNLPTASLASGHYILTLSTANPRGVSEDIADYSFLVVRR